MRTTVSVIALSLLLALSGCAGTRDWFGKGTGTTNGSSSVSGMDGSAGLDTVDGSESSIGGSMERGTGDTR